MRIKVGLLDSDTNYLKRMTIAFTSRFADKVEVYSFAKHPLVKIQDHSVKQTLL